MKAEVLKVVVIGDAGSGKTSLRSQYIHKRFQKSYKATIGADFVAKQVQLNNRSVSLQIWDTAGQERFQSLSSAYYRGADCCVLVFDLTCPSSLYNLATWIRDFIFQGKIERPETFPFVLIGNKCDLDKSISQNQGQKASVILKELIEEISNEKTEIPSILSPPVEPQVEQGVALRPLKRALSREFMKAHRESVMSFHTALSEIDDSIETCNEGLPYFETSAVTGVGIHDAFMYIASNCTPSNRQSCTTIQIVDIKPQKSCYC